MIKTRTHSEEEVFWDCREDSMSYQSVGGSSVESVESVGVESVGRESIRNRSSSTSGYSGSDADELQADLQDFAFEELGETAEVIN